MCLYYWECNFQWSQLILLLPYGFAMSVVYLRDEDVEDYSGICVVNSSSVSYLLGYYRSTCLSLFGTGDLRTDREQVANYIDEQTKDSDKIYVWDNSASIYLSSQRLSAATITTAEPYLNTDDNKIA